MSRLLSGLPAGYLQTAAPPPTHPTSRTMALRPRASSQPLKLTFFQSSKLNSFLRPRAVSSQSGSMLEDELSCPICCEIFKDPVVLKCSHSFCRACLQQFWNKKKARRECPVCRRKCSLTEPTVSLALKNVAETFLKEHGCRGATAGTGAGDTGKQAVTVDFKCSTHEEVLKLFCLDDFEVLCCVCHTSKKHLGHRVCPIEEGAQDLKVLYFCSLSCYPHPALADVYSAQILVMLEGVKREFFLPAITKRLLIEVHIIIRALSCIVCGFHLMK